jgi:hypothetical protein
MSSSRRVLFRHATCSVPIAKAGFEWVPYVLSSFRPHPTQHCGFPKVDVQTAALPYHVWLAIMPPEPALLESPLQAAPRTELHHNIRLQQVRLGLVCACTAAAAAAAADVLLGLCLLSCCCCSLSCAEGGDVIGGHLLSWWTNSNESQVACEAVNAGTCPHVCTVLTSC